MSTRGKLLLAALAIALSNDLLVGVMAGLSVVAVLAVEPLADRLWYARNPSGPAGGGVRAGGTIRE